MTAVRSSLAAVEAVPRARLLLIGSAVASLLGGWAAAAWSLWYQTADFFCLWIGGRFVLARDNPYDQEAWRGATAGLYPDPRGVQLPASCPGEFAYPYWTAIALAPLGALPIELAATLWMALNIGATIGATLLAWRVANGRERGRGLLAAIVLSSQAFWTLLASGQLTGVMLAIVTLIAWALASGRERIGGVAFAALLLKPQLGTFVAPAVVLDALARGRGRILTTAVLTAALMVVVAIVISWGYAFQWLSPPTLARVGQVSIRSSAWGLGGEVFGDVRFGAAIIAAVVLATARIAGVAMLEPAALIAISVPLSLLATPYVSVYDFLVLALPWAFVAAIASRAAQVERLALLVALVGCASLLPWVLFAIWQTGGSMTWSAFVPIMTTLLLAWALRVDRRRA